MKLVYSFEEGSKDMRKILGGKGANLSEMTNIGLPVPKGFVISTSSCIKFYKDNKVLSEDIKKEIIENIKKLEIKSNKKFNDLNNPLLVSVRSGASVSMPGMMDTILNLGMNDSVAKTIEKVTGDKRFAYDSYRRFISMFSDVVMGFDRNNFENIIEDVKKSKNVKLDIELNGEDMFKISNLYKEKYLELSGNEFPTDPYEQLYKAVKAVFNSWNTERAIIYRNINNISHDLGTAVNIQEMVYGNKGNDSGTGVAFTRNPSNGNKELFGEYLINAQGEDVVAGIRTPFSISKLKDDMPLIYEEFVEIAYKLEKHYKDMQDMEFTIENGKLFILQTRNGKRTASAAINIAVDMVNEGLIDKIEAVRRINVDMIEKLLHPTFNSEELSKKKIIANGLGASPGAASGKLYFNVESLVKAVNNGEKAILVRNETSPEDIEGMNLAEGILTVRGGMTSHAAVVARGMGKCCVSGVSNIIIDEDLREVKFSDELILKEGDYISLDGSLGNVYLGIINTKDAEIDGAFKEFMNYVDSIKTLGVRSNCDTKKDALNALKFGAEGIGLCRTEHMFFEEERIFVMRQMILAENLTKREEALNKLLKMQQSDFVDLFTVMNKKSVTIRYLDPPLHEFLPKEENEINDLAISLNVSKDIIKNRIEELKEFNPMMGHRGCRLAITYPEIAKMQTIAVINAAIIAKYNNIEVKPEIMIPLVSDSKEYLYVKKIVEYVANYVLKINNVDIKYSIGTMIETPRACIISGELAKVSEFFSFGTNDLTQMTYGYSRDDFSKFLKDYKDKEILIDDPFSKLDVNGVGELMKIAINKSKGVNSKIKLGLCGEHGGEEESVKFCDLIGLDYVSCSPFRVPVAKLAAAKSKIK